MKNIDIKDFKENVITLIGKEWMLITAGCLPDYNTMTASWGCIGFLWGKPVAIVFIRPQRYTLEFIERQEQFTLSFFDEKYRNALNICGSKSGRDTDKVSQAGLTPYSPTPDTVAFTQSKIVIRCKKLFKTLLDKKDFIDTAILPRWYPNDDLHFMFVAEIEDIWEK